MTLNFHTYVTRVFAADASVFAAVMAVFIAHVSISAGRTVFTAVVAENNDETEVIKTASTLVK